MDALSLFEHKRAYLAVALKTRRHTVGVGTFQLGRIAGEVLWRKERAVSGKTITGYALDYEAGYEVHIERVQNGFDVLIRKF